MNDFTLLECITRRAERTTSWTIERACAGNAFRGSKFQLVAEG